MPIPKSGTDSKVQKTLLWRETISQMSDNNFFELIRMYLGEIKTPFNKQKLIESLSIFLHKPEIQNRIISLLSKEDLQIITAITCLENPTQQCLIKFFDGIFSFPVLYDKLLNLEERLILFQYTEQKNKYRIYAINPVLENILLPLTSYDLLLSSPTQIEPVTNNSPKMTPLLLASILSVIDGKPNLCKQNGEVKKRSIQTINELFPDLENFQVFFQTIVFALINLSLLLPNEQGLVPNYNQWEKFSTLCIKSQVTLLAAAACGPCPRSELNKKANQILQLLYSIPKEGFSLTALRQKEFLILNGKNQESKATFLFSNRKISRLSQIMEAGIQKEDSEEETSIFVPKTSTLIQGAINLGLLQQIGVTLPDISSESQPVFVSILDSLEAEVAASQLGLVNLDANFSVIIQPGLKLSEMLSLVKFMELVRFDTIATFEINRNSCLRAFDKNITPSSIIDSLKKYLLYSIPQNLEVYLDDWYSTFSSAILYKGYLLHITDSRNIEENPILSPYILKVLAQGFYLMNFEDDLTAKEILKKSGFDAISSAKTLTNNPIGSNFVEITLPEKIAITENKNPPEINQEEQSAFFAELENHLKTLNLPSQQSEGLKNRIYRKIILSPQQLRGDSVKGGLYEASGMDFTGKIHLTEQAISSNSLLELTYSDAKGERKQILGTPLNITKKGTDATVALKIQPDGTINNFSLGQASNVRRLRGAIFET
ncbi:MAG: hypothetical protein E7063_01595 [Spirochaetaceae bacterium]|nr:hypothetical protein [Spirochaetaceae bacterium]